MEKAAKTITIDGQKYELDALSKEVKKGIVNLRAIDAEIQRLRLQLGIANTARQAVAASVKAAWGK